MLVLTKRTDHRLIRRAMTARSLISSVRSRSFLTSQKLTQKQIMIQPTVHPALASGSRLILPRTAKVLTKIVNILPVILEMLCPSSASAKQVHHFYELSSCSKCHIPSVPCGDHLSPSGRILCRGLLRVAPAYCCAVTRGHQEDAFLHICCCSPVSAPSHPQPAFQPPDTIFPSFDHPHESPCMQRPSCECALPPIMPLLAYAAAASTC